MFESHPELENLEDIPNVSQPINPWHIVTSVVSVLALIVSITLFI